MKQNQTITTVVEDCARYLEQNCYTKHRVERYKFMWRNGIWRYMMDRGIKNYNCSIEEEFINDTISSKVTPAERDVIRSISVLTEIQKTGKVSKRAVHPVDQMK